MMTDQIEESTSYDQSVYDLAELFIDDEELATLPEAQIEKARDMLAQSIQEAIESWLEAAKEADGALRSSESKCDYCGKDCRNSSGKAAPRCIAAHDGQQDR